MSFSEGRKKYSAAVTAKGPLAKITAQNGRHAVVVDTEAKSLTILMFDTRNFMVSPAPESKLEEDSVKEIRTTEESKTFFGIEATELIIESANGEKTHLWVTTELGSFPIMDLSGMQQSVPEGVREIFGTTAIFPFETITYNPSGRIKNSMTVTSINRRSVAASEFQVPLGYTEIYPPK
ncbi:MAG: DUF4412 domain-containing protein [Puniceicoccaceae bacterium]